MLFRLLVWCALLVAAPLAASAAMRPVTLDAMDHHAAKLVVVAPDGAEARYTPATLEALPTYALTTATPWRPEPATFEGVMLSDLLAAHGLAEAAAVRVIAENDFTAIIPRAVWQDVGVLVATRVDGRPHSRRARGPIQFVIDQTGFEASDVASEEHLVWMVARIEPVN